MLLCSRRMQFLCKGRSGVLRNGRIRRFMCKGKYRGSCQGSFGTWTEFGVEVLGVSWTNMSDNREVQLGRCLSR